MSDRTTTAQVAVIGGGPAGIEAACTLSNNGIRVSLFESEPVLAHNVGNKFKLFPDFSSASELVATLSHKLSGSHVSVHLDTEIVSMEQKGGLWFLTDNHGHTHEAVAVLLATGYDVFDARRKEELGYGIYKGVVTSIDLESMLKVGKLVNVLGEQPQCVTFLQCVGSRDEKIGNHYCSKVCCVTAVKQAIEVKKLSPRTDVFLFYMDLRMWGQGFEELYREAQEQYGIRFVRGRISEAASTFDDRVQIKAEDTLVGQPLKMSTDLLVLMVGMEASCGTKKLASCCGVEGAYGFAHSCSPHLSDNMTDRQGLFLAGSCKRPMSVSDTVNDARSAAVGIADYLKTALSN